MTIWHAIAFLVGGLFGYVGGACYGWLVGVRQTEERWAEAVDRKEDADNLW